MLVYALVSLGAASGGHITPLSPGAVVICLVTIVVGVIVLCKLLEK